MSCNTYNSLSYLSNFPIKFCVTYMLFVVYDTIVEYLVRYRFSVFVIPYKTVYMTIKSFCVCMHISMHVNIIYIAIYIIKYGST